MKKYAFECSRIVYKTSDHQTFSLLIKSNIKASISRLLIYNHGHGGLPADSELFAFDLIKDSLEDGSDVLLVSMPFTGLDKIKFDFRFDSWDGVSIASAKMANENSSYLHGIFEFMNTGKSHFMRYFIDNAVISTLKLRSRYSSVNYVGLSGGATTGLYTCSLLKDMLDNCILVAGVMPINLRVLPKAFGDSEQISSSFYSRNNLFDIIKDLSESKTRVHLIYNENDSCCFDKESASQFVNQIKVRGIRNVAISIRKSEHHDFDPKNITRIIYSR